MMNFLFLLLYRHVSMKRIFRGPFQESTEALMQRVGYEFHCTEDGRPCYHRQISDPLFPRFHAYVTTTDDGIEIDLHFDQNNLDAKSNHDQTWAYQGGRVTQEMERIEDFLAGTRSIGTVNRPQGPPQKKRNNKKKPKTLFETLFK